MTRGSSFNIAQRQDYFMALSVYKCIHGISQLYLSDCITMCSEDAVRNIRASTYHNLLMMTNAPLKIFKTHFPIAAQPVPLYIVLRKRLKRLY